MLLLKDLHEVLHNPLVEVLTPEVCVAVRGNDLEDAVINGQQGYVESTATQVINQDVLLCLLVETVSNGGGCWLVDDAQHIQPRNGTRILCRLPLGIVEVRWHRDHGVFDLLSQIILCSLLHLSEDHGRNFLRSHHLVIALDLYTNHRLAALIRDGKRQQLYVLLHG
mmetsp:Transcript_96514/g.300543  ORF Transcript_96514/g.300543 Transcript_96514/m.300543 type:complete len:167 (-) Transcript_96514:435-935(-)